MITVSVPLPGKSYDIHIEDGLLSKLDAFVDPKSELVLVTDDNIPSQYINTVLETLPTALLIVIPEGESSKRMEMVDYVIHKMLENGTTRSAKLLALGGGVVGDLAGFVASIYMRGIDFIQIPTTLLSQIDSSVGGKVGVNTPYMKNSIGSFKQPNLVLIDPLTLQTLEPRQLSSGIAEMIKYGLISSKPLFEALYKTDVMKNIATHIKTCVEIKRTIVLEDEYDTGLRQLLNFGHTIGHALEQYSNYSLLHGEAISIGMVKMVKGMSYEKQLIDILNKYNLPTSYDYDKDRIYQYITTDKKATKSHLNIILVEEVGKGYIKRIKIEDIQSKL